MFYPPTRYALNEEQRLREMGQRREKMKRQSDAYRKFVQKSENVATPFNALDMFQLDDLKREEILKHILEECFKNEDDIEDRSGSEEDSTKSTYLSGEDENDVYFLKSLPPGQAIQFPDDGCLSGEENPYRIHETNNNEDDQYVSGEELSEPSRRLPH
jgi:hypothetical protein